MVPPVVPFFRTSKIAWRSGCGLGHRLAACQIARQRHGAGRYEAEDDLVAAGKPSTPP